MTGIRVQVSLLSFHMAICCCCHACPMWWVLWVHLSRKQDVSSIENIKSGQMLYWSMISCNSLYQKLTLASLRAPPQTVVRLVDQYWESWSLWHSRKQWIQFLPTEASGPPVHCWRSWLACRMACWGVSGKPRLAVLIKYLTMTTSSSKKSFWHFAADCSFESRPSMKGSGRYTKGIGNGEGFWLGSRCQNTFIFSKSKLQLLTSMHSVLFRLCLSLAVSWHDENWGEGWAGWSRVFSSVYKPQASIVYLIRLYISFTPILLSARGLEVDVDGVQNSNWPLWPLWPHLGLAPSPEDHKRYSMSLSIMY